MATDLTEADLQLRNFRAFGKFMRKTGPSIRPDVDAAGFYAGGWVTNMRGLKPDRKARDEGFVKVYGALMKAAYKVLDERNKVRAKLGLTKIQTINDVIKDIRKHPETWHATGKKAGQKAKFPNLLAYAMAVSDKQNAFLPPDQLAKDIVWKALSHWYAKNAKGEIHIMEGIMPDPGSESFRELSELKVFISTELPALLKNMSLDPKNVREVEVLSEKYLKLLGKDEKTMSAQAKAAVKKLKSGARPKT